MSNFSDELQKQLEAANLSGLDLSSRVGMSSSQIYKWTTGAQTSINEDQITVISLAISHRPEDHARLLRAHLADETFGPGADLIEVRLLGESKLNDQPRGMTRAEKVLAYLSAERITNRDLNDLLIDLAKALGWQESEVIAPAKPKKPARSRSRFEEADEPVRYPRDKE